MPKFSLFHRTADRRHERIPKEIIYNQGHFLKKPAKITLDGSEDDDLRKFRRFLLRVKEITGCGKGCSLVDIEILNDNTPGGLPRFYQEFLRIIGKDLGDISINGAIAFENVPSFQIAAALINQSAGNEILLDRYDFVFCTLGDETYFYFNTKDADPDPKIRYPFALNFLETEKFSDFIMALLKDHYDLMV